MSLILFLIIGALAGWLAGQFMKGFSFGLLGNMAIGVVGSFIGGFALGILGFSSSGLIASIITATIGACILLYIAQYIKSLDD
jgi:uncharacterized membrane protein YeaQ/YmgE (transglycosylase-associated protein family)